MVPREFSALGGALCFVGAFAPLVMMWLFKRQHREQSDDSYQGMRTRAGVVMGHVYDPLRFRMIPFIISDEGQNRPEIVVVNDNTRDSHLLLIERDGNLTVLEIDPESNPHGDSAPLN